MILVLKICKLFCERTSFGPICLLDLADLFGGNSQQLCLSFVLRPKDQKNLSCFQPVSAWSCCTCAAAGAFAWCLSCCCLGTWLRSVNVAGSGWVLGLSQVKFGRERAGAKLFLGDGSSSGRGGTYQFLIAVGISVNCGRCSQTDATRRTWPEYITSLAYKKADVVLVVKVSFSLEPLAPPFL